MLSVTGFASQCFFLHLWEQLTWGLSRTSEDRNFINKALYQKAKEETNKTVFRTQHHGDYVPFTDVLYTQKNFRFDCGPGNWWTQTSETYDQCISFFSILTFSHLLAPLCLLVMRELKNIQQFHIWLYIQIIESRDIKRYFYIHVHSSPVGNRQRVEATQVSSHGWMDKQNVSHFQWKIIRPLTGTEFLTHTHTTTWMNPEDMLPLK